MDEDFLGLHIETWDLMFDQHEDGACELMQEAPDAFDPIYQCHCAILAVESGWFHQLGCPELLPGLPHDVAEARDMLDVWAASRARE